MNPDYPRSAVTNGKCPVWPGGRLPAWRRNAGRRMPTRPKKPTIEVAADRPDHAISPTLYGLMTEEINHAYDGGLYAELIQNRIFKDARRNQRGNAPFHRPNLHTGSLVPGQRRRRRQARISLDDTTPSTPPRSRQALQARHRRRQSPTAASASPTTATGESPSDPHPVHRLASTPIRQGFLRPAHSRYRKQRRLHHLRRRNIDRVTTTTGKNLTVTSHRPANIKPTARTRFVISANPPAPSGSTWSRSSRPRTTIAPTAIASTSCRSSPTCSRHSSAFPAATIVEGDTIADPLQLEEDHRPPRPPARPPRLLELPLHRRHGPAGIPRVVRGPAHGAGAGRLRRLCARTASTSSRPGPRAYVQDALDEIEYVTGDADHQLGRATGQGRPSRAVRAALRRDRQRGQLRQVRQLRRPLRPVL